jgi:hypothetical protein
MSDENVQEWEEYDARLLDDTPLAPRPPATQRSESEFLRTSLETLETPFLVGNAADIKGLDLEPARSAIAPPREVSEFETQTKAEALLGTESQESMVNEAEGKARREDSFGFDPYASIRSAMSSQHANLPANEVTMVLGRLPAALVLHQLLNSPEMQQATLASLLGKAARRSVRVNGSDISIPAYLRLVSRLCGEVAGQSEEEVTTRHVVKGVLDVTCTFPPAFVISGYSEYDDQMSPDQKVLITRIAQKVVDSFATDTPIVSIGVVGHADSALKKSLHERPKFEMDLSFHRAQITIKDLRAEIERLGRGRKPEPITIVQFAHPIGMGSTKKLVSNPINPSQMKLNRRVEVFFGECTVPPQWTWIDAALRGQAIVSADSDAHKRIRCMLELILRLREKADDGYLNFQDWKDLWFPPGLTDEQKEQWMRDRIAHLEKDLGGSNFGPANKIPDSAFINALESIDEVITRSMRDFHRNAEAGGAAASVIIVRAWKLIRLKRLNPNSIYSCYVSYSG